MQNEYQKLTIKSTMYSRDGGDSISKHIVWCAHSFGHPRESEEWKNMTMEERYAFFAPIWRVMRDDNVSVEEVGEQIRYVALSVKQGSQVRCEHRHLWVIPRDLHTPAPAHMTIQLFEMLCSWSRARMY